MTPGLRSVALAVTSAAILACSSTSTTPTDTGVDGDPFAGSGATGTYVSRDVACKAYADMLMGRATQLACTIADPPRCPDTLLAFETKAWPGVCIDGYDQGTLDNCKQRMATYTTCADFDAKPCALVAHPCSTTDGGTDGASDTSATDATAG